MSRHRIAIGALLLVALAASADDARGVRDGRALVHNITQGTFHATIQDAIDLASGGDVIEVGPDTYHERINLLGKAITLRSTDGPDVTIIDGDAGGTVITCTGGETLETVIEGFTITDGLAGGNGGGGMYNNLSNPTVTNCIFSGNSANQLAGGMMNAQSSPTLTLCTFSGNSAPFGGGIYNDLNSDPDLSDCTFSGNTAEYGGGGMFNDDSSPTLTDCTFSQNTSDTDGGGMLNWNSNPVLTGCMFTGNTAVSGGGGMNNANSSSPTLTGCTFSANSGGSLGGGIYSGTNCASIAINCTFGGNSADGDGGAIYSTDYSDSTVANCVFTGNYAGLDGGGMHNSEHCQATVVNCTFSENVADANGGAIFNALTSSSTLANCVLWANSAPNDPQIHGTTTVTYSCVQGSWSGDGNIDADPFFVDGDGPDDIPGTQDDDVRLSAGSPCIDAADNTAVPPDSTDLDDDGDTAEALPLDPDGDSRFIDDPDTPDTGVGPLPIVDMGAYEYGADCNRNGLPDDWDIAHGVSEDCQPNGVPDECELGENDCNLNDIPDDCDIAEGTSADCNANGVPDECETLATGVLYVDGSAAGELHDGSSWQNAYLELSLAAYHAACTDDVSEIRVAAGTYRPTAGTDREATFQLTSGVAIRGGYRGLAGGGDPNDRGFQSVLSGDIGELGDNADNSYHVVYSYVVDETGVLDGFIITDGNADGVTQHYSGGGMVCASGSPTLINCLFSGNRAYRYGGGMSNSGSPSLTNCTFSGNTAFSESAGGIGGGMHNSYNSSPTLTNCVFSGNSAFEGGGGMSNIYHSAPTLINCTFSGNSALLGGGVYNEIDDDYDATLVNCTFIGNAGTQGAGMYNENANPTLTNCAFTGNTSNGSAGGVYNTGDSSPVLINCMFTINSARFGGGGMANYVSSSPTLANCTFSRNTATSAWPSGQGGGFFNDGAGSPTLANCILWDNAADDGQQITGPATVTYSCIQDGWPGLGNISANPLLGPHSRLMPGSPCIDAGDNAGVLPDTHDLDGDGDTTEPIPLDLHGLPRFHDDPATGDTGLGDPPIVDMGAYEYVVVVQAGSADLDGDGDVDIDDFGLFQQQFSGPLP